MMKTKEHSKGEETDANKISKEDKREAVNIGIGLSNQLITTSLALIAVNGAATTILLQIRDVRVWFYITAIVSFFSFLASIYCGGKGINNSRNSGFKGNWTTTVGKSWFDKQAKFTFVGVVTFCLMFFTGKDKVSLLEKSQIETNKLLIEQINVTKKVTDLMIKEQEEKIEILTKQFKYLSDSMRSMQDKQRKQVKKY